jgi:hypothetical protein
MPTSVSSRSNRIPSTVRIGDLLSFAIGEFRILHHIGDPDGATFQHRTATGGAAAERQGMRGTNSFASSHQRHFAAKAMERCAEELTSQLRLALKASCSERLE